MLLTSHWWSGKIPISECSHKLHGMFTVYSECLARNQCIYIYNHLEDNCRESLDDKQTNTNSISFKCQHCLHEVTPQQQCFAAWIQLLRSIIILYEWFYALDCRLDLCTAVRVDLWIRTSEAAASTKIIAWLRQTNSQMRVHSLLPRDGINGHRQPIRDTKRCPVIYSAVNTYFLST